VFRKIESSYLPSDFLALDIPLCFVNLIPKNNTVYKSILLQKQHLFLSSATCVDPYTSLYLHTCEPHNYPYGSKDVEVCFYNRNSCIDYINLLFSHLKTKISLRCIYCLRQMA
jgi:hypothetical protein